MVLFSCKNNSSAGISVRTSAKSKSNSEIEFCVYPENEYGMIANGAAVCVVDESNITTPLTFSNEAQCFTGYLSSTGSTFTVKVKSNLSDEIITQKVPHTVLTEKPVISTFTDSDGNNLLSADSANASKEIQLSWKSYGDDVVYRILITTNASTVYSKSTKELSLVIPAGTLSPNTTYYAKITAQKIFGDATFMESDYYSVSEYSGSSVMFSTSK